MIYVIATLRIRAETRETFVSGARVCIGHTRQEPGCLAYDLTQHISDRDCYVFVERWESRAALERHFTSEHMKAWRAISTPSVIERKIEIIAPETVETL